MDFISEPKPQSYYKQHLLVDIRDFKSRINNKELSFMVKLTDIGVPPYSIVQSVELKAVNFPKIQDEMYFILDVPEFSGRLHSSDNVGSHDSFAIIYYDNSNSAMGYMKPMKGKDFDEKKYIFNPPEKNFNKFTINFRKYGGNIVTCDDVTNSFTTIDSFVESFPISLLFEFEIK